MMAELFVNTTMPSISKELDFDWTSDKSSSFHFKNIGKITIDNFEQKLINWILILKDRCIPKEKKYFNIRTSKHVDFISSILSFMHCKSSLGFVA